MSSAAPMTREFAWKPRWAVIMLVNSVARSTFDISTVPAVVTPNVPAGVVPGVPTTAAPDAAVAVQRLPESRDRPGSLANFASDR